LPQDAAESDSSSAEQLLQDQIERLLDRLKLAGVFGGDKFAPITTASRSAPWPGRSKTDPCSADCG
jgi:hypothetical protein